jgi:hypothetical protein
MDYEDKIDVAIQNAIKEKSTKGWNLTDSLKAEKKVYKATGDRKAAIRAYCSGHKWLTENAKAVGNW